MKNILLIIPTNVGTIASVSFDLYNGLRKLSNIRVYVVCLGEYSENGFRFDTLINFRQHRNPLKRILARVLGLKRIKKEYAIDESISTLLGATYWNVLSGIGEKKVGIFHTRLAQMKYGGILYYWGNFVANKILCTRLDKMIAVNKSAYLDLKRLHHDKSNIELVYNIHDFAKIKRLSLEAISESYDKSIFSSPVILYVGNLYCNIKGTDRLLKSFLGIHQKYPNYKLVFIGSADDGSYEKLKDFSASHNLTDSVYFLGRKSNPYKYMKHAKILVSPSRDEGLPGVLIEALSLGLKVVATNSTMGVWEIMECIDEYDENLSILFRTRYGYICPNKLDDEDFTIQKMTLAIEECLSSQFEQMGDFDTKRFSEKEIIPHYIIN